MSRRNGGAGPCAAGRCRDRHDPHDRRPPLGRGRARLVGRAISRRSSTRRSSAGEIDLAVHSLKDVPSALPPGIVLAAVPKREDPADVLVARPRRGFADLPRGARVGTSSPRRRAQVLAARPDLDVSDARGNVDTRLRRLAEGRWDAIVLARAGLARLERLEEICDVFAPEVLLPAIGQGALAVVARADDGAVGDAPGEHRRRGLAIGGRGGAEPPRGASRRAATLRWRGWRGPRRGGCR